MRIDRVLELRSSGGGDYKLALSEGSIVPMSARYRSAGRVPSSLTDPERFDLVLGITCHAVYHAGQVQLIKRLRAE